MSMGMLLQKDGAITSPNWTRIRQRNCVEQVSTGFAKNADYMQAYRYYLGFEMGRAGSGWFLHRKKLRNPMGTRTPELDSELRKR